jgi:ATP-dependent Zn protease
MSSEYTGYQGKNFNQNNPQNRGLLGSGWRPLHRQLDLEYLLHLASSDPVELAQKTLDAASDIADAMGRHQYSWFANILNVFSENTRYEIDEFWNYITPEQIYPNYRYKDVLMVETPVVQLVSRASIPIDYVLNKLQEITIFKILDLLGKPDTITQLFMERNFYYPPERFINWERLEVLGTVYAYWSQECCWLQIDCYDRGRRRYTLISQNIALIMSKATYNLAVILSGYKSRVGQVNSQYPIRTFPADVQSFTDTVQQAIFDQNQLAVLISGAPGTGKTAWTQAVAKEILVPLGYVIFILDHDAVENFVPPTYLERICIIINEADNLAQDRSTVSAQRSNKTEHILSLLDGTLYQSVIDQDGIQFQQKLVVLMTCNTTERLDSAILRKGRVDFISEFTHKFV